LPRSARSAEVPALQGQRSTWFAGAWMGYGFHEDGLKAGLAVAQGLRARIAARASTHRWRGPGMSPQQARPLMGFGEVRHTRLRPARNAFVYPTYFLMLPMRSLRARGSDRSR
jgi:hypothetical protein